MISSFLFSILAYFIRFVGPASVAILLAAFSYIAVAPIVEKFRK